MFTANNCYILKNKHFVGTLHELGELLLNYYSYNLILIAMLATLCFSLL